MNIPTQLTILRMIAVPVLVGVYYTFHFPLLNMVLFIIAGLTDYLDGYIARKYDMTTDFGAFLDPIADKFLVIVILLLLISEYSDIGLTVTGGVIILREFFIISLREWVTKSQHVVIKVSNLAKYKTAFQMLALAILLYSENKALWVWQLGYYLLVVSMLLSLYSLYLYIKSARSALTFSINRE